MKYKISTVVLIVFLILNVSDSLPFLSSMFPPVAAEVPNKFQDDLYRTFAEMEKELKDLAKKCNDIMKLHEIGKSSEGRSLYAVKVSDNPDKHEKDEKELLLMALHHARECVTTEITMELIKYLCDNKNDPKVKKKINEHEIWIVPMVNPDGHVKVEQCESDWRKNTRKLEGQDETNKGVDLNRNYGKHWGPAEKPEDKSKDYVKEDSSSRDPKKDTYIGPSAFSEPETKAIKKLVEGFPDDQGNKRVNQFKLSVSWHSYGGEIYYPWGYKPNPGQPAENPYKDGDPKRLKAVAEAMSKAIAEARKKRGEGQNSKGYDVKRSADLYPTAGDTDDWLYSKCVLAFTVEAYGEEEGRPDPAPNTWAAFNPTDQQTLKKVIENNIAATIALLDEAEKAVNTVDEEGQEKSEFNADEEVYLVGGVYPTANASYPLHIVGDTDWIDGMPIPPRVLGTEALISTNEFNIIPISLIWNCAHTGQYDIVVDVDDDGVFNKTEDPLLDNVVGTAGFIVLTEVMDAILIRNSLGVPGCTTSVKILAINSVNLSKIYFELTYPFTLQFASLENAGTRTDGFELEYTATYGKLSVILVAPENYPLPPATKHENTPILEVIYKVSPDAGETLLPINLSYSIFYGPESIPISPMLVDGWLETAANLHPFFISLKPDHLSVLVGKRLEFYLSAADHNLDELTMSAESLPGGASLSDLSEGRGLFVFTPTLGQVGRHIITFWATDNGTSGPLTTSFSLTLDVISTPVGGFAVPIDKLTLLISCPADGLALLTSCSGLTITLVAIAVVAVYARRRWLRRADVQGS